MKSKPALSALSIDDATKQSGIEEILQSYKQAIADFCENAAEQLSDDLEQFLLYVAKTGETLVNWEKVQKVFILKLKLVLDEFYDSQPYKAGKIHANCENDSYDEMKERLIQLAGKFESPPFTIQRLCELITNPRKNYSRCEKFMRALEKNLMVVTSWSYPNRKNSETSEQLNGVFETRTSFGSIERPWAALPHSPIATTPPSIPPPQSAQQSNNNPLTEEKLVDVNNAEDAGAVAVFDSADRTALKDSSNESVPIVKEQAASDSPVTDADVSENRNDASVELDSGETATPERLVMIGDAASVPLTNTEKDALKEPLPGVGTLVEKHSVKATVSEAQSSVFEMTSQTVEKSDVYPSASPKRKLEKEEVPMELGNQNAKRLKSDSEVPSASTEEANV